MSKVADQGEWRQVVGAGCGQLGPVDSSGDLNGGPAPGYSSGQAQQAITRILAETLPKGMGFEWTELTYQQEIAGNTAVLVFPICVLIAELVPAGPAGVTGCLERRW